jgi:glyoxylase-like metal-dependent hydrolase (beta-lactamase superfamily II)
MTRNIIAFITIILLFTDSMKVLSQIVYSNNHVELTKLDNNVFLLKEKYRFTANILAITGDESILLLDTGFREIADDLVDAVKYLGKNVEIIINSHGHGDHVGANTSFGSNAIVMGHENCNDRFASSGLETITFDEEYSFDFSGNRVICRSFTGGHSNCDIVISIPDLNLAYLGDIYLSESFPLIGIGVDAKAQKLVSILKEIHEMLPEDTRLFAGHGKETTASDLSDYISMLETTIDIVRKEMIAGKSLAEIKEGDVLAKWSEWGEFFTFITKETWIEQICASSINPNFFE